MRQMMAHLLVHNYAYKNFGAIGSVCLGSITLLLQFENRLWSVNLSVKYFPLTANVDEQTSDNKYRCI